MLPFYKKACLFAVHLSVLWLVQAKTSKVKDDAEVEEELEREPSEEEAKQKAVAAVQHMRESHGPAAQLPSRPILGVNEDLSGAALVRRVSCIHTVCCSMHYDKIKHAYACQSSLL